MKIANKTGLAVEILENGTVGWFEAAPVMISLRRASVLSGTCANVWLRKKGVKPGFRPLTGPGSDSRFRVDGDSFIAVGSWDYISYECCLRLSAKNMSWEWRIDLLNRSGSNAELDLVCLQDVGLKTASAGLINEYYVSQYTERRIIDDPVHGKVVFCRQNMKESGGFPWLMLASSGRAASASTDGMQFYGRSHRATGIPEGLLNETLGGEYAGESSVVALQEEPFILPAGKERTVRFVATYLHNHPPATSEVDLDRLPGLMQEFGCYTGKADVSGYGGTGSGRRMTIVKTPGVGVTAETGPEAETEPGSEGKTGPGSVADVEPGSIETTGLWPEAEAEWFCHGHRNLFTLPDLLQAENLDEGELENLFPGEKRHKETVDGRLLSFFCGDNNHVMLRTKEILVDRPHGHIMHTGSHLVPDEGIMSTTAFAFGVFNSHLTQGNTNFNTLLSVCNSQFNINPFTGQRIFIAADGRKMLLGVPSAFEMGLNHCRWIYKYGNSLWQVCTWTSGRAPRVSMDFQVLEGDPVVLIITHDFDELNGWSVKPGNVKGEYNVLPAPGSMISGKYPGARFRISVHNAGDGFRATGALLAGHEHGTGGDSNLFIIEANPLKRISISFTGGVAGNPAPEISDDPGRQYLSDKSYFMEEWASMSRSLSLECTNDDIEAIREILPWFGMNAATHFLTPYGLEQFSGAAWGTRDISQGPVELLLSMGRYAEARKVLELIFSNQEPDGGWPQWWMFDRYNEIRADNAHGDVIYWCLIAVSSYIRASGDFDFLETGLPYYNEHRTAVTGIYPLREHLDRLVKKVIESFIPGRALVRYGGGDWNDSLQPVSRDLADRLISSWTVEMNYQAFKQYAEVCTVSGDNSRAAEMQDYCERIRADFNSYLVRDDVVAGYGLAEDDGKITLLLHPSDTMTGIRYSLLPMERGIVSGIFTAGQAACHLDLIERYLKGPDGARLMDRPLKYSGGIQIIFQRAESSTFFGREIGLMYVHEHIRYAEALACTGRAGAFLNALRLAVPVDYRNVVQCGDIRQSNCYYSSSDAVFGNRYMADGRYHEITEGKITLRGGWRVYSSGPGIFAGIIMTHLLGLRREWGRYIIDPVLPAALDGLKATVRISDRMVTFRYHVREGNCGPRRIVVNGSELSLRSASNPYRAGGAIVDEDVFTKLPSQGQNIIEIYL